MYTHPKRLLYYFLDPKTFFIKHHLVVHNIKFLKHLSFSLEGLGADPKAAPSLLKHIKEQKGVKSLSISNMSKSAKNLNAISSVARQNRNSIKNFSLFPSQLLEKKECIKSVQNIVNLAHIKLPARKKELKMLRFCRNLETLIPHHSGLAEICMASTVTALKRFLWHKRNPLKLLKMFVCNKKYECPEAITPTPEMCLKIDELHYVIEQHLLVPFNVDILFRKYILQRIVQLDLYLRESSFLDYLLDRGNHLYNLESLFFSIKETSNKEIQKILFSLRNLHTLSNLRCLSLWIVQHISNKEFFSFLMNARLPERLEQLSIYAHVEDQEMNNAVLRRKGVFFFPSSLQNLSFSLKTSNLTAQIILTFALIQMVELRDLKSFDFKVVNTNRDNYTGLTSTAKSSWTNEFRLNLNDLLERLNQIRNLESFSIASPYLIFNGIKEENFPMHLSKMREVSLAGSYPLLPCNLNSYIKVLSPENIQVLQIDTKEVLEEIDFIKRLNLLSKMTQLNFLSTNVDIKKNGSLRFEKIYIAIIELIRALRHLEKLFFSVKSLRLIDDYAKILTTTLEFHQKLCLFDITGNNFSLYKNIENGFGNLLT